MNTIIIAPGVDDRVESPIEAELGYAIIFHLAYCQVAGKLQHPLYFDRQAQIGAHRVDILLKYGDQKLVIEADGYKYHKSQEKMISDRSRDRDLIVGGYTVCRFMGVEIKKDPLHCAELVATVLGIV